MVSYQKLPFELRPTVPPPPPLKARLAPALYVCGEALRFALDTALVTRRPLLLSGDPGTGKSTLARWVAANLGWRYYKFIVASDSRPSDLLYRWDAVHRLADAQAGRVQKNDHAYVEPGPLWWALDPKSAEKRGASHGSGTRAPDPGENWGTARPKGMSAEVPREGAILLIDEIDKADVDFPNDLLDPLDVYEFTIKELSGKPAVVRLPRESLEKRMPGLLIVITTNRERDLPSAFVRRCTVFELEMPDEPALLEIARKHFDAEDLVLYQAVARIIDKVRRETSRDARRPATAEYIDAIRACGQLGIRPPTEGEPASEAWDFVEQLTLRKAAASGQS